MPESLSVKERILLHLFDFTRFAEEYVAPVEVTQAGISKAVGIRVQHIRQNVGPLIQNGLVEESTRHIQQGTRRRKVYFLAPKGRAVAASLRRVLLKENVPYRSRNGATADTSLQEVIQTRRRGSSLIGLLEELEATGTIGETARADSPGFVEMTEEMPPVGSFYGRDEELRLVLGLAEETPATVLTGIAGIGKTTLGSEVCSRFRGKRSIFWRRIRPWDTAVDLALRTASFLKLLQRRGLHGYLVGSDTTELARVADYLVSDLAGVSALLVFDDVHNASDDATEFLAVLRESLSGGNGTSALLIGRSVPSFYSRRDVEVEDTVAEVLLGALSPKHARAILRDEEVDDAALEGLIEIAGGNPLFLKLLSRSSLSPGSRLPSTLLAYVAEEIEPSLQKAGRECLEVASFYEVPVPVDGFLLGRRGGTRTVLDLQRRGLLDEVDPGIYRAHDLIREYFRQGIPREREETLLGRVVDWLTERSRIAAGTGDPLSAIAFLQNALMLERDSDRLLLILKLLGTQRDTLGDLPGAIAAYEAATALTSDSQTRAVLQSQIAICHTYMRSFDAAHREIDQGLASLPSEPSRGAGWLYVARARTLTIQGRPDLGLEALRQVSGWTAPLDEDPNLRGWVYLQFGLIHTVGGRHRDFPLAIREISESLEPLQDAGDRRGLARAHEHLAILAIALGRQKEAKHHVERCTRLGEDFGDDVVRFRAFRLQAIQVFRSGDLETAERMFHDVLRFAVQTNMQFSVAYTPMYFVHVYRFQGRLDEAREAMEYFLQTSQGLLSPSERIWFLCLAIRVSTETEDLSRASEYMAEAEDLLAQHPYEESSMAIMWAQARLDAAGGENERAEVGFRSVRKELPRVPFGPTHEYHEDIEFLIDYGRFLAASGAAEKARKILNEAAAEASKISAVLLQRSAEEALRPMLPGSPA